VTFVYSCGVSEEQAEDSEFVIEELARRTGMTVRTLRAYQSRKLLPPPQVRARTGYYTEQHVVRVELIKDLQSEGFKLETIARMLDKNGSSDGEILRFSRTVKSLFGDEAPEIVSAEELAERFPGNGDEEALLQRAEKLGVIRRLDDDRFEELSPRLLQAGDAMRDLGVDARQALKIVEQLRRHAEGVAKLYVDLFLQNVWKPFADADQPDDQWPTVQDALQRLRPLAEEALLAVFDLVMAERVDDLFGRELVRSVQAKSERHHKSAKGHR
jgi:DNA-binding transcriptional MerR regulator